jgi:hypothetical protein
MGRLHFQECLLECHVKVERHMHSQFPACRRSPGVGFATEITVPGSDQLRHHISVAAGQTDAGEVEISAGNRRFLGCLCGGKPRKFALFGFAVAANNFGVEI